MNIEYKIGNRTLAVPGAGAPWFLLTNSLGDYAAFPSGGAGKYYGWIIRERGGYVKILDAWEPVSGRARVLGLRYGANDARRIFRGFEERIWLDPKDGGLNIKYSKAVTRVPWFDVRSLASFPEWNRVHECVKKDPRRMIIRARAESVSRYIAVVADGAVGEWNERWALRKYPYDAGRSSRPDERYAWSPCTLFGKRFSFGAAETPERALRIAERGMRRAVPATCASVIPALPVEKDRSASAAVRAAAFAARHSFSGLSIKKDAVLRAGLPWFGVPWSRDAIIASRAFPLRHRLAILAPFFAKAAADGTLPAMPGSDVKSADAICWLYMTVAELPSAARATLERTAGATLVGLLERFEREHMTDGLVANGPHETWMDSIDRSGARIELQALMLRAYAFLGRRTGDTTWRAKEEDMRERVRRAFWNGETLADGAGDPTIRANLFFALYLYPGLLEPAERERCFAAALRALYLPWGGMATLDTRDPQFHPSSTGEDPASYHQGDSWFFLNNLAALALLKQDAKKYAPQVKRIIEASTHDILAAQAIGCASELSSAERFAPAGAWNQAWSASTYLELVDAYYGRATNENPNI